MLDLHLSWTPDGRMLIWGEDHWKQQRASWAGRGATSWRPGGRRPGVDPAGVTPHLFSATRTRLKSLLEDLVPGLQPHLEPTLACVELPTLGVEPQPSPTLRMSWRREREPDGTGRFEVEGYLVSPVLLNTMLFVLQERWGLTYGATLAFWGWVSELAVGLVATGRLVPYLAQLQDGRFLGQWQALLEDPVVLERLQELAASTPPAAFACRGTRRTRRKPWRGLWPGPPLALDALRDIVTVQAAAVAISRLGPASVRPPRGKDPVSQWVRSLIAGDTALPPRVLEEEPLLREIRDWARDRVDPVGTRVRPVLRLGPEGSAWRASFGLRGDPGDLDPGRLLEWLDERREVLGRMLPALAAEGSRELVPDEPAGEPSGTLWGPRVPLDPADAQLLLELGAEKMAEIGWLLEVPDGWLRRRLRRRARVRPGAGASRASRLGLDALCTVEWDVVLDGEALDRSELEELLASEGSLVQVGERWVTLGEQERQALARHLTGEEHDEEEASDEGGSSPLIDALRAALGLGGGLEVEEVVGEGWLASLLGRERAPPRERPVPRRFRGELRDYQRRGVAWLRHLEDHGLGACLADDMGLGKTVQLLALMAGERRSKGRATLLVAPLSLLGNWRREAERFVPSLRVHVYHGPDRGDPEALAHAVRDHDLVLTTYGVLAREREALSGIDWHRLVLDEAQAIKNPSTRQARAARAIPAERRVALTGTPVENHLLELWSIMQVLNPGLLGSRTDFRERFARPIEKERDPARAEALRRLVGPFVLRRRKSDPALLPELPDKIEGRRDCRLTREQAALYSRVTEEALEQVEAVEGMKRRGLVLALLTKLKKICNHPEHFAPSGGALAGRSGKLAELDALLDDLEEAGERALCFTQFRGMGELLRDHLAERFGEAPAFLHGGVSAKGRDRMVAGFQAGEGPPVFLLSLRAGGTGLNLTAASHVIHFDRWWNPAVEDQATDRAHRIGQERSVQVHKLVCVGTLEERIHQMIEEKRDLAETIVGGGEAWVTELSTDELRNLLTLTEGEDGAWR